jgi:protein-S-isoprenylcysteine O-methyltransferase Ste14
MLLYARPSITTMLIGLIIALPGELIRFWGVAYAGSETRTTKVGGTYLVTQGPFAYLRNPLYLGNIIIYFGVSVMSNSLFPYLQIAALIYFYVQYHFIIREEENFLREKFKEKYEDYYNKVSSMFPSFTPYENSKQSGLKFNFKAAYESEKRTLQAISTILIMILLIYALINQ